MPDHADGQTITVTRMRRALTGALLLAGGWCAGAEPQVITATFTTAEAPLVTPTDHGPSGQNARVDWTLVAPGPTKGADALYLFASSMREDAAPPPVLAVLDLSSGRLHEIYPGDRITIRQKAAASDAPEADDMMDAGDDGGGAPGVAGSWCWGLPRCAAAGPEGQLFLGTASSGRSGNVILAYRPQEQTFREVAKLPAPPVGMVLRQGVLWILDAEGTFHTYDDVGGLEASVRMPQGGPFQGLCMDDQQVLYTASGQAPYSVLAVRIRDQEITAEPVLPDGAQLETLTFHENLPGPWCEGPVKLAGGHFALRRYALHGGKATAAEGVPDQTALARRRGYDLQTDFTLYPLQVGVRRAGQDWRRFPVVFQKAAWDNINTLCPSADGRYVYGAGWPTAWIWRFEPGAGQFRMLGQHYVIYEMHPYPKDPEEVWAVGYWGVKLMRWRPNEPWTFDYPRHYGAKTFPGDASPWGDKDVSNPRLVCKFRYLKKLFVRRPSGLVLTDDGRAYVGAHTPAVEYFNSRYGGGISWYDPATETIGQIRDPFIHHSIRDLCRAGPHHVAAVASQYISPFEPLPADFSPGKFVLVDTRTNEVVLDTSPVNAALSFCEEGEPGRVVAVGYAGKYGGDGIRGNMFIFDVATMQVTHAIRLPVKVVWMEYNNVLRFERGPDRRLYFYGQDDQGVALCRVDSQTGKVEPVLRGHHITDVASYNNKGAAFAFVGDRVYFGAQHLVSLPVATLTGKDGGK